MAYEHALALPLPGFGTESASSRPITGIVIGRLAAAEPGEPPRVDFPASPAGTPLPALSTVALEAGDVGREVALAFERGDPARPVVLGLMHRFADGAPPAPPAALPGIEADGGRVTITAAREIVLRCGKASLTLTAAGKVLLRGAYLLSRSSGVNAIKGGSVQIN